MKTFALIALAALLAGCSSFNLGAFCYIPHGVSAQCSAATVQPVPELRGDED